MNTMLQANPINPKKAGLAIFPKYGISDYGRFHFTFLGYTFYDTQAKRFLSKSQLFFANKKLCIHMADTLSIPTRYRLVNTPGWYLGIYMKPTNS